MPSSIIRSRFSVKAVALAAAAALFLSAAGAKANPKLVADVATGRVIAHQDAFLKWYPASLTKLMTVYITFKALKAGKVGFDRPVTISKRASEEPPSKMFFKPGSQLTLDSALKILLVKSANDVAVAIAETLGGSVEQFVAVMNAEARRLGMVSTRYINPHGLPGQGQYTTARDQAILAIHLKREFPQYQGYFSLEGIDTGARRYPNFNTLIGRFPGADGMKTGFICASGFNLVGSATRGRRSLVAVVLGADSLGARTDDTANLLQQGFSASANAGVPIFRLAPYGDTATVMDVSAQICNPQAAKVRSEGRDEAGRAVLHSPYIREMARPPVFSFAGLIPASAGSSRLTASDPAPQPKGATTTTAGGDLPLRVPVPLPRPYF